MKLVNRYKTRVREEFELDTIVTGMIHCFFQKKSWFYSVPSIKHWYTNLSAKQVSTVSFIVPPTFVIVQLQPEMQRKGNTGLRHYRQQLFAIHDTLVVG